MFLVYPLGEVPPTSALYICRCMNISFHSLIFICAIYSHFTGRRGGGKFPPLLCCLYLQIHKYFFPFSKFLSCVIFSFFKFTIISFHLLFLAFSLGEIFPKHSDVSSLLTGGKFPPTCALYICRCMIISFHSLIFICAIYIHFTRGGGGFLPLLSFLYLQIHNYFFPFSQYLSCVVFSPDF